jgi:alkylmercury lyase
MTTVRQTMNDLTEEGGPLDFGPNRSRLFVRVIRKLALGRPVSGNEVADLIADLGIGMEEAGEFLARWTERDAHGNLVGLGITLNETPHRYVTNGTSVFAWCALDTLIFPQVLNRPGRVQSRSPASGGTTALELTPDGVTSASPPDAVISLPVVERHAVDTSSVPAIWSTFCHRSYFFPSRDEGERWAREKEKIAIASLDEGVEIARDVVARILAYGS